MKYFLMLLGISCFLWGACKKNVEDKNASQAHGTLYFQDPAADGVGFYYKIDTSGEFILSPDFSNPEWNQYINVHTSLKFVYLGKKSCYEFGMAPLACGTPLRSVEVISFTKLP
ncbi:hypothetical protein ACX0G9_21855 [Flavitalea flava]